MAERWVVTVEAVGIGAPTVCRVRRLLRAALRRFGLKAVAVTKQTDPHLPYGERSGGGKGSESSGGAKCASGAGNASNGKRPP